MHPSVWREYLWPSIVPRFLSSSRLCKFFQNHLYLISTQVWNSSLLLPVTTPRSPNVWIWLQICTRKGTICCIYSWGCYCPELSFNILLDGPHKASIQGLLINHPLAICWKGALLHVRNRYLYDFCHYLTRKQSLWKILSVEIIAES